jgi:hypothetical protein
MQEFDLFSEGQILGCNNREQTTDTVKSLHEDPELLVLHVQSPDDARQLPKCRFCFSEASTFELQQSRPEFAIRLSLVTLVRLITLCKCHTSRVSLHGGGDIATTDKLLEETENVRKLLMLLLFKIGASQDEIASALNVTQARVSQMLPSKDIKPAQICNIGPQ